jgi:hypothetical protein
MIERRAAASDAFSVGPQSKTQLPSCLVSGSLKLHDRKSDELAALIYLQKAQSKSEDA